MTFDAHVFSEFRVGQEATFKTVLSQRVVDQFVELSGDTNPLHTDVGYALGTEFKKPVVHGMILGALFSRLVGTQMPGKYALYLSQDLEFHSPAFIGDEVTVKGQIVQKVESLNILKIDMLVLRVEDKKILAKGLALVKVLK